MYLSSGRATLHARYSEWNINGGPRLTVDRWVIHDGDLGCLLQARIRATGHMVMKSRDNYQQSPEINDV